MNFPVYIQAESKDCGATCLKIIAKFYGKTLSMQQLREMSETTREGANLLNISEAAEALGFRSLGVRLNVLKLNESALPCIIHWNKNHYVVLYKIKKGLFFVSDPAIGLLSYSKEDFIAGWIGNNADDGTPEGIALLLEPLPKFTDFDFDGEQLHFNSSYLLRYIYPFKKYLVQLCLGLAAGSLLQLIFPFLTQSIIDVGIQNQDIQFIYIILIAQLFLFIGRTFIEFIRSQILLQLSARISINIISDFFTKLLNLPIAFFDVRLTGDLMQRINDHNRIERLLTISSLNVLFSAINVLLMGCVLAFYSLKIFAVFFIGSAFYLIWVVLFLKRRKNLDYKRFSVISTEQSKVIELISGMQEIKLNNAERQKLWSWQYIQARLFKISLKSLNLEQFQSIGSNSINELKNILIIVISAKLVLTGEISLGMMLAITSIVGTLNGPILQLIDFIREVQDAKISIRRLAEIHDKEDEIQQDEGKVKDLPDHVSIMFKNVSFRYQGAEKNVLNEINLEIPANKVTAIVGSSGSGKTTLLKIILKFYEPGTGEICVNKISLKSISNKYWRSRIGTVMQEGYIFNDTVANNIAVGEDFIDHTRLEQAVKVANISEMIEDFALKFNTKIGAEGVGMSTGQKQRLMIARAVYKNPSLLLLDEATSSLDSNNEKEIMGNLHTFFEKKTVVIIAHRLSTVVNADQIIVLDNGRVVESGNHKNLLLKKGHYFNLVKNQLQLDN